MAGRRRDFVLRLRLAKPDQRRTNLTALAPWPEVGAHAPPPPTSCICPCIWAAIGCEPKWRGDCTAVHSHAFANACECSGAAPLRRPPVAGHCLPAPCPWGKAPPACGPGTPNTAVGVLPPWPKKKGPGHKQHNTWQRQDACGGGVVAVRAAVQPGARAGAQSCLRARHRGAKRSDKAGGVPVAGCAPAGAGGECMAVVAPPRSRHSQRRGGGDGRVLMPYC